MAQTGYTPIFIYSSSTSSNVPAAGNLTNSTLGSELAINITDGKLFYKDNTNAVQVIGWKTTPTTAGGTGLTSYTAGDLLYYATGTTLSKLSIGTSGQWLGSSGTAPQWNSPAALTKTDDTNVTLTLGGSASTALLNAASLTLGWTGQLAVSRGGTGIGSYTAGDLLYASGTTTLSKLAIGTANYVLTSSGSAPQWTAGSSISVGTASNLLSNATTGVMQIVGPAASTTRVMTIPNANFTAARTDAAQSFTGDQTLSTGNIIQGTAGKGFDFTANSAAAGKTSQLLNVYEEGTFNFTLLGGSGTFTSQTNRYTKIGRTMIVNFDITINTISGSNADTLVGLPYGALAGAAYGGTIGYFSNAANSTTFPGVYASTTTLYLVGLSSAATSIAQWNALGNGTRITGTIVYATT